MGRKRKVSFQEPQKVGKQGGLKGGKVLNTFHIDDEDFSKESLEAEQELDEDEEGQVKSEDDEDIDSDEAFDESDEERFSSFKFSGSSSNGVKKRKLRGDDDEDQKEDEGADDEDDDEMYMDLSEMLASGQATEKSARPHLDQGDEDSGIESEARDSDEFEDELLEESEEDEDDGQLDKLNAFVDSLVSKTRPSKETEMTTSAPKSTQEESNELAITDILSSLTDPSLQSLRKSLAAQQTSKSKSASKKLSAPLAKPIQERLERQAAYEETKTEISKWQNIVKANREADHLEFPMNEPAKQSTSAATLAGTFEPSTSLEKNIDELLRQSGLRDEKEITTFEDLAMKKISIDEVRERQIELQKMRDLMFRQEQKAKRLAKIKSKSYRRLLKREREREQNKRLEEGEEESREAIMKRETARAKERMTLRHKNTGEWAKKMLGRGQHDLETRQAISEQIRRGDELQRKIMGEEDGEEEESDSAEELEDLVRDPSKWGELVEETEAVSETRKGVMGMKFMRDAEERQRQLNLQQLEEMREELRKEEGSDGEVEDAVTSNTPKSNGNLGRKTFTPGDQETNPSKATDHEGEGDDEEEDQPKVVMKIVKNPFHMDNASQNGGGRIATSSSTEISAKATSSNEKITPKISDRNPISEETVQQEKPAQNMWLSTSSKKQPQKAPNNRIEKLQNKRKRDDSEPENNITVDVDTSLLNGKPHLEEEDSDEDDVAEMRYSKGKVAFRNAELMERVFAGDDMEADFIAEKEAAVREDAPKEEDLTLPGWGSWVGQGVKKRATERKFVKEIPGIEESKRKDAKLKHVIINEKKSRTGAKYLAQGVPYPFETREQYERSLSMPVGPEWTSREMYQKITKPRISIRAGTVVNPLKAPFK